MAGELRLEILLSFLQGNRSIEKQLQDLVDITTDIASDFVQTIGSGGVESIYLGDVFDDATFVMIKNLDDTNFVKVALEVGLGEYFTLRPGRIMVVPEVGSGVLCAQADSADVNVMVVAVRATPP